MEIYLNSICLQLYFWQIEKILCNETLNSDIAMCSTLNLDANSLSSHSKIKLLMIWFARHDCKKMKWVFYFMFFLCLVFSIYGISFSFPLIRYCWIIKKKSLLIIMTIFQYAKTVEQCGGHCYSNCYSSFNLQFGEVELWIRL